MKKLFKSPWLELSLMSVLVIISYIALMLIPKGIETPPGSITASIEAFFWNFQRENGK